MTEYLPYVNQQGVGEHTEEWFRSRSAPATAVVDETKAAGVHVFAGGLEEAARTWAAKITEGCGWAHEVRRFAPRPPA